MSATIDACVLIAWSDPTNADHERAVATLAALTPPLYVHPVNLAEVLVPYAARDGMRDRTGGLLDALRHIGLQVHDESDASHAVDLACVRAELGVKMPDACAVATAWETNTPLATFDERLARAVGRTHLPVSLAPPVSEL